MGKWSRGEWTAGGAHPIRDFQSLLRSRGEDTGRRGHRKEKSQETAPRRRGAGSPGTGRAALPPPALGRLPAGSSRPPGSSPSAAAACLRARGGSSPCTRPAGSGAPAWTRATPRQCQPSGGREPRTRRSVLLPNRAEQVGAKALRACSSELGPECGTGPFPCTGNNFPMSGRPILGRANP